MHTLLCVISLGDDPALRDVGMNIKHVSDLVDGIISSTAIKTSGLKAGIKTGFMVLLNNLFLRKGGGK